MLGSLAVFPSARSTLVARDWQGHPRGMSPHGLSSGRRTTVRQPAQDEASKHEQGVIPAALLFPRLTAPPHSHVTGGDTPLTLSQWLERWVAQAGSYIPVRNP